MKTAAKWQESYSRKVTACWLRWLTLSVHLCVIPVGHYSCRNCNFTTITTNWFPQLAGRTFSFRFVSPILLRAFRSTIMQQSCTHPPTNSPRGFFRMRGNRREGGDFRLWHMHCKFILGSQLCHMMSLTVLRFICTVKSGNCTYVCGVGGGGCMGGTNLLGPHIFHFTLETSTFVSSRFLAPQKLFGPGQSLSCA